MGALRTDGGTQTTLLGKIVKAFYSSFGIGTGVYVSGTSATIGNFFALQAITDTVVASGTNLSISGIAGVTIPAGTIIYLNATSITLTSGTCILYNL